MNTLAQAEEAARLFRRVDNFRKKLARARANPASAQFVAYDQEGSFGTETSHSLNSDELRLLTAVAVMHYKREIEEAVARLAELGCLVDGGAS